MSPGWVNVDLPGENTHLASDRPDLVEAYITHEDDYYGRHKDKTPGNLRSPLRQEYVCDRYGSFEFIPCRDGEADHILARHVFEHLSVAEGRRALQQCLRKLRPGGILTLDVPDHYQTLIKFRDTGDEFYIRHLIGPRSKGDWGHHVMSYDPAALIALVESEGFVYVAEHENIHFYPAFCLSFSKP